MKITFEEKPPIISAFIDGDDSDFEATYLSLSINFIFCEKDIDSLNKLKLKFFDLLSEMNFASLPINKFTMLLKKHDEFTFGVRIEIPQLDTYLADDIGHGDRGYKQTLFFFQKLFEIFEMSENYDEVRDKFIESTSQLLKNDKIFDYHLDKERFIKLLNQLHSMGIFTNDEWLLIIAAEAL